MKSADLLAPIRKKMRADRITVSQLALRLKKSVPTLHRWLKGKGLQLENWMELVTVLGLDLDEVLQEAKSKERKRFQYSLKQEEVLSATPGLLAFFQQLQNGKTPEEIAREYRISQRSLAFYLRSLDQIGLLRWGEDFEVSGLEVREPIWRKDGPLRRNLRNKALGATIDTPEGREQIRLGLYSLSASEKQRLKVAMDELFASASEAERISRAQVETCKTHLLAVGFYEYQADFLELIPEAPASRATKLTRRM